MFCHLYVPAGVAGDQLFGDVLAPSDVRPVRRLGQIGVRLPVPVRGVRVQPGRRRVRDPGRGHQTHRLARGHRPVGYRARAVAGRHRPRTVVRSHRGGQPDRLVVGLHARQIRGGRARRVGHLFVHAVRLKRFGG